MGCWLEQPQIWAVRRTVTSQGGPGGHFLIWKGKGWITGTEMWETWPESSGCNGLLGHPRGDFPQDKTNVLHIKHRGQGA